MTPASATESPAANALTAVDLEALAAVYRDLHAHPELGMNEYRTGAIAADHLRVAGFDVTTGVGGTGVVGVLRRGHGPTVLLRADMDGLPVLEETGLAYASTTTVLDRDSRVPTMHACGHDMHVSALIGAATELAADTSWAGTVLAIFQPAEELGEGARAMLADDLYGRFGRPDVVLGQHVTPMPAGLVGAHPGPAFAAADTLELSIFGQGGHGSRPETTVDPVLLAAEIITRLHTIVSREISAFETAVLTIGQVQVGSAPNIIADSGTLTMSLRTFDATVRERVLAAIRRIAAGEAQAAGAPRSPELRITQSFPVLVNDPAATAATNRALAMVPGVRVVDPGALTGSEDVGHFADAAGCPGVYWLLGGADPDLGHGIETRAQLGALMDTLPSNHSPLYTPVIHPTLEIGIGTLVAAATHWLGPATTA